MPILRLEGVLSLDGRGFQRTLQGADRAASRFVSDLKSRLTSAFTAGAVIAFTKNVIESTLRMKDYAEQFDITAEEAQQLDFALNRSGLDLGQFGRALARFTRFRREAAEGNEELRASAARFGITLDDLNNPLKDDIELVKELGVALETLEVDSALKAAFQDLFGQSGTRFITALKELREQSGRAPIVSEAEVDRLDRAVKRLGEIKDHATRIAAIQLAKRLGPVGDVLEGKLPSGRDLLDAAAGSTDDLLKAWLKRFPEGLVPEAGAPGAVDARTAEIAAVLAEAKVAGAGRAATLQKEAAKQALEDAAALATLYAVQQRLLVAQMTPQERRLALTREITALEEQAADAGKTIAQQAGLLNEAAKKRIELLGIDGGAATATRDRLRPDSDALARVGAFIGQAPGQTMESQLQRQTEELRQIRQLLDNRGIRLREI